MSWLIDAIIAAVALQRLGELWLANRNTAALKARGAVEVGAAHYPVMVALHLSWLAALLLAQPRPPQFYWQPFLAFLVCQGLRVWIIASLGPYWTTRVLTLPEAPLVRRGPYRFVRHPNYWIVAIEIAVLPLSFGEGGVALVFSLLNAAMLAWRVRVEEAALAPRRTL